VSPGLPLHSEQPAPRHLGSLRLCYISDAYVSLARTALDYRRMLQGVCQLTAAPEEADVVVLHVDLHSLKAQLQHLPRGKKPYLIGYLVWETESLRPAIAAAVQLLDEVWTPSAYCHALFSAVHPRVRWVPHAVALDTQFTADDSQQLGRWMDTDPKFINFLTVTKAHEARKNTDLLIKAFAYVQRRAPLARLIVKTVTYPVQHGGLLTTTKDGVVTLDGAMPAACLSALHASCQIYASAHCAEGWGLPLSDAMLFNQLVVATGYSGNMDFMTPFNSLPVSYSVGPVGAAGANKHFSSSMAWATAHREDLEATLWRAYRLVSEGGAKTFTQQAQRDIKNYSFAAVQRRVTVCMREVAQAVFLK
jgi:glycosyltransferase involved in cell wall biosynthesis